MTGGDRKMYTREFIYPDYDTFTELKEKNMKNRLVRKRKVPNVKFRILNNQEIGVLLNDCDRDKGQTVVSEVYELLEKGNRLLDDEFFIAPINFIKKMAHQYQFQFCLQADGIWNLEKAEYKGDGCVYGKPIDGEHVYVIAEYASETCLVDVDGLAFVPELDKRTKVIFPRGFVEEEREFKIQISAVELNRFREYRKRSPKLFDSITGFSPVVRVDSTGKSNWKKRVKVIVPIETCADVNDDDDALFFRLNDGSEPELIAPGRRLHGHSSYYSVDIDRVSSILCCLKKSSPVVEHRDDIAIADKLVEAVRFLSGRRCFCHILVFIKFDPVGNDAVLLFDCVESTENRPQKLSEKYVENGFEEVLHTGLNDVPMDDNSRIDLELDGSLKLLAEFEASHMNFHLTFRRISPTNVLKIPIRPTIGKKVYITVTLRRPDCDWEYSLQFQADRNLLNSKNVIIHTCDGLMKEEIVSNVKGTSKKTFSNNGLKTPR